MKITISKRETKETLVYLALWLLLFIAPVISNLIRTLSHGSTFRWEETLEVWSVFFAYLVVFVIHNYFLAPLLIYRNKKWLYFLSVFLILVLFTCYQCNTDRPIRRGGPPQMEMMDPGRHGPGEPMARPDERPPHHEEMTMMGDSLRNEEFRPAPMPGKGEPLFLSLNNVISLIVVLLTIGMNLGIKLYFKSDEDAKELQELERKSLEQQLAYLKYQINPHFFMNTLNNIHALVDIDPEKAKDTILELSKMMRYVLYEGDKQMIPLQRETDFLKTYISLMRLRYTDKVKISVSLPERVPEVGIPPLLLITFVENAFKHGISYKQESFIDVRLSLDDDRLKFTCKNSNTATSDKDGHEGGVGLTNVKQRLTLLYGDRYTLDFDETENIYEVLLLLPLNKIQES